MAGAGRAQDTWTDHFAGLWPNKTAGTLPPRMAFRVASTLVVNGVLQSLASLEFRGLGGWNGNLLAGARIARNAGGTIRHREGAKADKLHLFALLQRIGNDGERRLDDVASLGAARYSSSRLPSQRDRLYSSVLSSSSGRPLGRES